MNLSTRTTFLLACIAAAFSFQLRAAQATLSGHLVDKACSQELAKKGQKAIAEHDRHCALMDPCLESGFGVITADGKFVAFDAAGNKKAVAAIKASKKDSDYKVTVTGDQQGGTIKVASMKLE